MEPSRAARVGNHCISHSCLREMSSHPSRQSTLNKWILHGSHPDNQPITTARCVLTTGPVDVSDHMSTGSPAVGVLSAHAPIPPWPRSRNPLLSTSSILPFPTMLSPAAGWSGLGEDRADLSPHQSWPWRHRHPSPAAAYHAAGQCRALGAVTLLVQDWAEHPRSSLVRAPR